VCYDVVRIVLSIVLLTAAGLKVYGLATESYPHNAWLASRPLQISTVLVEVALAIGLVTSPRGRTAWAAALGFFAIVAGVSLYTAIRDLPCCCIGNWHLPSWFMFGIDTAAILALSCCQPFGSERLQGFSDWFDIKPSLIAVGAGGALMVIVFLAMTVSGSRAARHQFGLIPNGLLAPTSKTIDFGRVPQRGQRQATFELTNSSRERVEVAHIWSSCPCVGVDLETSVVEPSQRVVGQINLDLTDDADFRGSLLIDVEGRSVANTLLFSLRVSVTVTPTE
jgi:hypothetical protein